MSLPNIFTKDVADQLIARIQKLSPEMKPVWGKMNPAQMLAHCCVAFEYGFEPEKHTRPNAFVRWMITTFAKKMVVGEAPFPHNSRTAPDMVMTSDKDFATEQARLIAFVSKVQAQGADYYDGLESWSFGKLTKEERNNLFYKHIDHHLQQFGV